MSTDKSPYIAIFGDVHGALDAVYKYCEYTHEHPVALILQTGDLGVFPGELDKATRKRAGNDPTELGMTDYVTGKKASPIKTVFVRGNHEDHIWLQHNYPKGRAIDPSGNIIYLNGFIPYIINIANIEIVIAGLGGANRHYMENLRPSSAIDEAEINSLLRLESGSVNIFLTHDAPKGFGIKNNLESGAEEITFLIGCLIQ